MLLRGDDQKGADDRIRKHFSSFYSPMDDEDATETDLFVLGTDGPTKSDVASDGYGGTTDPTRTMTVPPMLSPSPMSRTMTKFTTLSEKTMAQKILTELHHEPNAAGGWFTTKPNTPTSKESHASFWNDMVDELGEEKSFQKLVEYENFTQEKLQEQISGNWTRRFVQKRTKPKMINSLHRERIDVLIKMVESDRVEWRYREIVYINLALRVRIHAEIAEGWSELLHKAGVWEAQAKEPIIPAVKEFEQFLATIDDRDCPKHHLMLPLALEKTFRLGSGTQSEYVPFGDPPEAMDKDQVFADENRPGQLPFPMPLHVQEFYVHLNRAKDELNTPLWDTHDHFYVIDAQVDKDIFEALKRYSDFTENPLIKQNTKNFRHSMSKLLTLYRTTSYCRRRLQALMPALMADFAMIEMSATNTMLDSFTEWIEYMLAQSDFGVEEWRQMKHHKDRAPGGDDMLRQSRQTVQMGKMELADFISSEIAEVKRLQLAQIEIEGPIVLTDLLKVVQKGPYGQLIPTGVPTKMEDAIRVQRERLYRDMEAQHGEHDVEQKMAEYLQRVGNRLMAYGVLLNQGILYVFAGPEQERALLCVQMAVLDNVHVDGKCFLLHHPGYDEVVLELPSEDAMKEWLPHVAKFCQRYD